MRGFAVLLAYVVGLSAVIGVGITGLMALQSSTNPTPSAASVVAASQKERLAKPIKQAPVAQKDAQPRQKHKATHVVRKRNEEAPTFHQALTPTDTQNNRAVSISTRLSFSVVSDVSHHDAFH